MATNSITDNVRDDASDLINYFKLDATRSPDYTLQTSWERSPVPGSRKAKVETRWYRGDNIGHGAFGAVWVERNNSDASASTVSRAVKEVSKAYMKSRGIDVRRELVALAILSKYTDEFVQFLGWFEDTSILYLTMEYMPLGDLDSFIAKGIPEQEVKAITLQLLEGLSLMHKHSLAHRDLKPANIFVKSASPRWLVKIGDFGIAKRCRGDSTALQTEIGTQGYLAPEIAVESNEQYTNACDIWSLGCVVYKALTQILPFPRYRDLDAFCSGRPFPVGPLSSKNISITGLEFLEKLLAVDPTARLTAEQALKYDWLIVSGYPPRSVTDLENQEVKWINFQERCHTMESIIVVGSTGASIDSLFGSAGFLSSFTNPSNPRQLRRNIQVEQENFSKQMRMEGGGIEGLPSERQLQIDSPIELLKSVYGDELSIFPEVDLKFLFMVHSKPWFDLAVHHVERCFEHCVNFLFSVLVAVLTKDFRGLGAQLFHRYLPKPLEHLRSQALHELKQIEKDRMRFSHTKSEVHMKELIRFQEEKSKRENKDPNVVMRWMSVAAGSEWTQNQAEDFIGQMLVYYSTEQARFIDNVGVQVVERHLVDPLSTLLRDVTMISREEFYALYNESVGKELAKGMEELDKRVEKLEITARSL